MTYLVCHFKKNRPSASGAISIVLGYGTKLGKILLEDD